ncbi:MAG: gliding motility-associated C-terminal domain-containing protein [Flavobacteriaceae bacterium]|nr:gliding motility-associated C-terminal domain-containing protein [Flavobacteriaceae bacterium]
MKKSYTNFQPNLNKTLAKGGRSTFSFLQIIPFALLMFFTTISFSQTIIDCAAGPVNFTYCYGSNDTTQFVFTNTSGLPLNLVFNAGEVENNFDEVIVLDTDGVTDLNAATPYGNGGDLTGLSFQSSGDTITLQINSDSVIGCQTDNFVEWDWDVWCQTCLNPTVTFATDGDCTNGNDFNVSVNITDMGSATEITVNDDQGSPQQTATNTGILTFGPYAFDVDVVFTVNDANDPNCFIVSPTISCLSGGPGSLFINAGDDQTLSCNDACTDITATFLETFESFTDQYIVDEITYEPPFAFDGLANSMNTDIDDSWSDVGDLPFDFCFFANTETQFQVGSNGVIRFEVDPGDVGPGTNGWAFTENLPNNDNDTLGEANVFTPGHDIDPLAGNSEEIAWEILGAFPNRVLVVSFYQVAYFSCNELEATHMAVFYEFSNVIEIYIQDKPTCEGWNGGNAVVGIQNNAGTIAYVPPGRQTSDSPWTTTNEAWSFSPQGDPTYEFAWLDESGTVIGTDPTMNVCPSNGEETYTAQITYTNCNGDVVTLTDDVTVTLVADFTLELGDDQELCDEASYEIIPETTGDITGATYLWSPGGETTPTLTVTTSGTYTLEMTRDDCSVTDSVEILLNESPVIELGDDITTCFEAQITLDASPSNLDPATVTYEWSLDGTVLAAETNPTLIATQYGVYSVIVTNSICTSEDSITIIPSDDLGVNLGDDYSTCFNGQETLDATPSNIDPSLVTYEWSLDGTVIAGETTALLDVTTVGTYSVVVTSGQCIDEDTIVISPANDIAIELGDNISTCLFDNIVLDATPYNYDPNVVTYEWSLNGTVIAGETGVTLSPTENGTYSVTVSFGDCTSTDTIVISSANDIEIELGEDFQTCFVDAVWLDASPLNYDASDATYQWFLNGDVYNNNGETLNAIIQGEYSVIVTVGECSTQDTINLELLDELEVSLETGVKVCPDQPVTLVAETNNTDIQYQWYLNGQEIVGATNSTLEVVLTGNEADLQTYRVTINKGRCFKSAFSTITLYRDGGCTISQGLSPNEDGFNDRLDLEFLADRTGIDNLQVFNRSGVEVYKKNNYIKEWKGQTNDEVWLPTGVYYYVITLSGNDPVFGNQITGWIYVNIEAE